MRRHTIVPHDDGSRRPFDTNLKVLSFGNVVVKKVEQIVALFLFETDDAPAELGVYEEGFFARGRVRAHERMDRSYRIASDDAASKFAAFGLFDG
jgi:hypothetical protein